MSKQKFIYILIILLSLANLPVYAGLQSGTIISTGTITATTFVGSGFGLTGLVSSQITDLTTTYLSLSSATATYSPKASPTFTGNVTMPGTGIWNSSGNVGLGTTSPAEKLQISNGAIRLDRGQLIKWGQNGESTDDANITVTQETSDQTNMRFRIGDVSDANDNFIFQRGNNAGASDTELMRINAAGNVGIGTTSPTHKLEVIGGGDPGFILAGTSNLGFEIRSSGDLPTYIDFTRSSTNNSGTGTPDYSARILRNSGISGSFEFEQTGSGNFVFKGGNVGIGTTNPLTRLHVVDSVSETQFRLENTNASGKAYYRANSANSTVNATFGTDTAGGFFWVETNHPFKIATNGSERLKIDTSGNVGIGTTSPTVKLEVSGRIKDQTGFVSPVGSIMSFAGQVAPSGWFLCDGSAVSRGSYAYLFAIIGTTYGAGDGSTTFNLPNLKGKVVVGYDSTENEFDALGETGGEKTHSLTTSEMPIHSHGVGTLATEASGNHAHTLNVNTFGNPDGWGDYGRNYWNNNWGSANPATSFEGIHTHTITGATANTGSGSAHNIVQPYITLNYIIKY